MRKISEFFLSENFQFLDVKFSSYMNRHVLKLFSIWSKPLFKRGLVHGKANRKSQKLSSCTK